MILHGSAKNKFFMLSINFYLREPQADKETPIIMTMILNGEKMKYSTEERIHPAYWDSDRQRARTSKVFTHGLELNVFLENLYNLAVRAYRELQHGQEGEQLSLANIKKRIDQKLDRSVEPKVNFFSFFEKMIAQSQSGTRPNLQTGKPITANTIRTYATTLRHLREFATASRKKIDFNDITLGFYGEYTEYLMKTVKLSTNTIGKHIQIIKLIMNEAMEMGFNSNIAHKSRRFIVLREKSDSIYLNKDELVEMEQVDLSRYPKLERVRDLFLVGCYTGLRFSDYSILKPENIRDGLIEITQVKTNDPVVIPVHDAVTRIMAKYGGQLPRALSNQKTNDYLKDLGEMIPCLWKEVLRSFTKEGKRQQTKHDKWELLTTHTARRSFATNEYLAGTPTLTIMAITGHKTEKAFLRYIKLVPSDHARLMKAHWERRKLESKVAMNA
jgi:Phage integrase SAM-like domain/Phage integrase family